MSHIHTSVGAHDTTSRIAGRLGVSNEELLSANPHKRSLTMPNGIRVFHELVEGEQLAVPRRVAHQFATMAGGVKPVATPPGRPSTFAGKPAPNTGMGDTTSSEATPGDFPFGYWSTTGCAPGFNEGPPGFCFPSSQGSATGNGTPGSSGNPWGGLPFPIPIGGGNSAGPTGSTGIPGMPGSGGGLFGFPVPGFGGSDLPAGVPSGIPGLPGGIPGLPGGIPGLPGGVPGLPGGLPSGFPTGFPTGVPSAQGNCPAGQIEITPGFCIPNPAGGGSTPGGTPPVDLASCQQSFGPNYYPAYVEGQGWGCIECRSNEYGALNGFCFCREGTERKDPNDPYSDCVPVGQGGTSSAQPPATITDQCYKNFGPNAFPWNNNGEWVCGYCDEPAKEIFDPVGGGCYCRPDYEREVLPDGSLGRCVLRDGVSVPAGYVKADATTEATCNSPNIWLGDKGCYTPPANLPPTGTAPNNAPLSQPNDADKKDEGMSTGAKIGLAAGALAAVGLIAYAISSPKPATPSRTSSSYPTNEE